MKHALLIICHKNLEQVGKLIEFFDEEFVFYIHIDKQSTIPQKDVEHFAKSHCRVKIFRQFSVTWGGINILRAELYLLRKIIKNEKVDYIHFCSGQDYPIKRLDDIKKFYEENKGREFIEFHSLPFPKWNNGTYWRFEKFQLFDYLDWYKPKHKSIIDYVNRLQDILKIKRGVPNQYAKLYGGSNWMSITFDCAKYVSELKGSRRRFFNRLRLTFAPDEVYFHTVILNSHYYSSVVNDNKRLIIWKDGERSPQLLTKKDWWTIVTSDKLWARKFDLTLSSDLFTLLDKYVSKHNQVTINSHGFWENNSFDGHVFDIGLAKTIVWLIPYLNINTAIDFGCGPGWYVKLFHNCGVDMQGYDGNPNVEEMSTYFFNNGFYCQCVDLSEEVEAEVPVDLVFSIEVGEHIPQKSEQIFIDNLTRNSKKYIILSWGVPGQAGDGHVNCRTNQYIIQKLIDAGVVLNTPITQILRANAHSSWLQNSIMFFEKNTYLG